MSKISYKIIPIVMIVYKIQDEWRGFCVPYDITCHAKTQERAKNKLEILVKFYEEGLSKYKNPKHLIFKKFSNNEDRLFFNKIWPYISKDIESKLKSYNNYAEAEMNSGTERKIPIRSLGSRPFPSVGYFNRAIVYSS